MLFKPQQQIHRANYNEGGDMLIESNLQLCTHFTYINCTTITARDSINPTFFIFWNLIFEEDFCQLYGE